MVNNFFVILGNPYLHCIMSHDGSNNKVPIQVGLDKTRYQV